MPDIEILLVPYYHTFVKDVVRPYCLNYSNSSGELAATRFTYDSKGRNDMAFYQQIMGSRSSRNLHEFDKAGRMVRKFRKYNDDETSTELFFYDEQGRLTEESFESSRGPKGTASYQYDSHDCAIRMICNGYKGWLNAVLSFDLDQQCKRLGGRITMEGNPAGSISYKYDRHGNLTDEVWNINDSWSQSLRYVYESL